MKKIITVLILIIIVLGMTGCQTETTNTDDDNTAQGETTSTYAVNITVDENADIVSTVNGLTNGLCSWTSGGQDVATIAGNDYAFAPVIYISDNAFDSEKSLTEENIASDKLTDTSITVNQTGVNGVIINNSDYTIENSKIAINADDADGTDTCDFSGLGSALAVYGDSHVTVKDSVLKASGVADMGLFVDNGAAVLLDHVNMSSSGGTLYADYVNSPSQETMVAPPWILGIMGNSRCSNLMGDSSTLTVIDSEASAAHWAVLSADSGSGMVLNVVNSSLTLTGSDRMLQEGDRFNIENPYTERNGYGTYVIGDCNELFLGDGIDVGTYAAIFTGGNATYGNLTKGQSYDLLTADGDVQTTYKASEDIKTVINSDTFGFMAHQQTNDITFDGIEVNSAFTDFLVKSGCDNTITVKNGTELNAGNGILLQLMDNDDSTTEFDGDLQAFGQTHEEYAGFPSEAVNDASITNTTVYNVIDTDLTGAIYNGIGYKANELSDGNVKPMTLQVNLSGTSTLKGPIAMTSCVHTTYEGQMYLKDNNITAFDNDVLAKEFADKYQATSFSQPEYFNIGQVANLVKSNGLNRIEVTLSDSAVWTVNNTSLISSLKLSDDSRVVIEKGIALTVDGKEYQEGTYTASDF